MSNEFRLRLLVVDDEPAIRELCVAIGASLGFECAEAESAEAALARFESESPDIALLDLQLGVMSGDELLLRVKSMLPRTEVAVMTGHSSIESGVEAMQRGAYDYIAKPFGAAQLKLVLQRMAEKVRLVAENQYLRDRVRHQQALNPTGNLQEIERHTIERVFQQAGGDKALAVKMLGISRATLYRKLKRYRIQAAAEPAATAAAAHGS